MHELGDIEDNELEAAVKCRADDAYSLQRSGKKIWSQ